MRPCRLIITLILFQFVASVSAQDPGELYFKPKGARFSGPSVVRLQRYLYYKGFDLGPDGVDGWFGVDTEKALRAYQAAMGLPVTGRIAVKDIPGKLEWKPMLEYESPPVKPALWHKRPYQIEKDGTYNTGYGPFIIDNASYGDVRFVLPYIFSPNKRFCYTQYYSAGAELQVGQPLIVLDTLTSRSIHLSALNAYLNVNDPGYEELYGKTYVSEFTAVVWTVDNNLYLELIVHLNNGDKLAASRVLVTAVR